ncbi:MULTISPECIES: GTPBP1 family GTP-binding protein [Sulfurisphaera]|uniref:GTP-binding protein n=2 Tax=Sulfurisphaera tokodaii TaxID=111955 RepID=Q974V4_SULTO|nr:GTP-binding protein [Sulfurisphaera tokodaii]BAB65553.1 putative GTP-binding protein [Sulfurisphaera tokodaii str. 7]HII74746.1 elongation factor 1-alpha [Sulfurisphaera tokodaii]
MNYPRESEDGKIEYKLILTSKDESRLQELASQMKYRLEEGGGEAFYIIGVSDNGEVLGLTENELNKSLEILSKISSIINAKIVHVRKVEAKKGKYIAEVLVRIHRDKIPVQVNIAVMGHVNAGKSTLTGALIFGKLDDGNGTLRAMVAKHVHEVISGRTSSITLRVLGLKDNGEVVNWNLRDPLDEADVTLNSSKIIRLVDLGGHERYLRTTLKGLLGYEIDYVMLVVGSDDGLSAMGKEHLAVASILHFPIFIVITKIDKYPKERINEIITDIRNVLKIPGINRLVIEVESEEDLLNAILAMRTGRVVPIFKVSNVTGEGLSLLIKFLNMLPPKNKVEKVSISQPPLVYIDEIYNVTGVGTVILGSVIRGSVNTNDIYYIGPTKFGEFKPVKVKSIQLNRIFVDTVYSGSIATFAIQGVEKDTLRKGMVLVKNDPKAHKKFKAKVIVLHHPTTIREGYVATLHLYTIRQAVKFEKITKKYLRTGDSSEVVLSFLYRPEYIEKDQIFVFREGRTRGLGIITELLD